nr:EthD domain-containing protein [Oryzicola mucosus]
MSIFRRKQELEPAEFQAYWRDIHAPIAVTIPALQRYEQNYAIDHHSSGNQEFALPIDGICKLQFADESATKSVMSPEMIRVLVEDEAKFIEGLRTFVVHPAEVVPVAANARTKCISLVTRCEGLNPAAFKQRWNGEFARWIEAEPGIAGYVQNFVTARTADRQPASYDDLPVDCVDEIWLGQSADSEAGIKFIRAVERYALAYADALNIWVVTVNAPPLPVYGKTSMSQFGRNEP